jgi:hypothetical protein
MRIPEEPGLISRESSLELLMRIEGPVLFPNEFGNKPIVGDPAHTISPVHIFKV